VFYADFNKAGSRHCSEDVKKEVLKLRKENVDGIVIDLRDNGGGSLQDVVDMAGLFVKSGPMVQVKGRNGAPYILEDKDTAVYFDGPLVIMVNTSSASASEIMAAAMQDYHRAIIIGTTQTYGKGTVQRIYNMDDYLKPEFEDVKPLGSVKMTVQKFYRINGGATQLKGVTPDIIVPDAYSLIDRGEKESDYPMPWDEIKPANYSTWNKGIGAYVRAEENSKKRIHSNPAFKLVTQQAEKYKRQTDKTLLSMNLEKYRKEEKVTKDENKKFEDIYKEIPDETISNLAVDIPTIESDTQKINRNKEWLKNLKKDPYIFEATNVLNDMK
jgi:carboxyl-terminal processing protease